MIVACEPALPANPVPLREQFSKLSNLKWRRGRLRAYPNKLAVLRDMKTQAKCRKAV